MFQNRHMSRATEAAEPATPNQSADSPTSNTGSEVELRSLAPEYKREQHASYVRHLEAAVMEPRNKNIALTGRYGSGKSSILDHFLEEQQKKRKTTLRISINTLGPDDDEGLTNRIQKELVKQLVYRAKPGEIRHSRFARRKDPTWHRTLLEAAVVGVVLVGLLWLFGVRPDADALGTGHVALPAIALLVLVVGAAWAARWVIGNRLVSQFSTGGTSISFDKQPESYFDEYLDEIVAFFDATEPDLVVFEDLDRFDDPRIFDSLRELNTLVNASAHWKDREQPLRFVYAIKDSLFEKLGEDPQDKDRKLKESSTPRQSENAEPTPTVEPAEKKLRDAAEAAVERANRTKFFEIVIPVVPFLSHSNARDLLSTEMEVAKLPQGTEISRGLLDIVARHATDMRLLLNIRNEFVVFAEKLLWIKKEDRAPGLTADSLFALVVYKNFHLADFEKLPHRGSVLDELERKRRQLVHDFIAKLRKDKQDLLHKDYLRIEQEETARVLGDRLVTFAGTMRQTIESLNVKERSYTPDEIGTPAFWKDVSEVGEVQLQLRSSLSNHASRAAIKRDQLNGLFPKAMDPHRWGQRRDELDTKRADLDHQVAILRGADFATLARQPFIEGVEESFIHAVNNLLPSQLARDLVLDGYLTRYYAEYSAVFYGDFLGVDVANFFRNCVWPNEMDVQFTFETTNAVQNILEQAPRDFTRSRSALNIEVVDHLLENEPRKAEEVVSFLVDEPSEDSTAFLDAFLNDTDSRKHNLVHLLAAHPWSGLFDHLALPDAVADEATRTELIDAALLSAPVADAYTLQDEARALIIDRYTELTAFTTDLGKEKTDVVVEFILRIGLIVPSLRPLSAALRQRVVEDRAYELTADNLRAALGLSRDEPIALDRIREDNDIWRRCRDDITGYLDAVNEDEPTEHTVLGPEVLSTVVQEQHETWTDEQLAAVLESSAPAAALPDITEVSTDTWPAIGRTRRMVPSAVNLHKYAKTLGVDEHLTKVLRLESGLPVAFEGLEDAEPDLIHDLRVRILNASQVLGSKDRVSLALELDPESRLDPIDPTELRPSEDDLLADLLEAGLVPETAVTFEHFLTAGWRSVAKAFEISEAAKDFLTPELVTGHVLALLRNPLVPKGTKAKIVADLGAYAANGDGDVLREAASFAHKTRTGLPLPQVEWAAPHVSDPEHVLWQLSTMDDGHDSDDAIRVLSLLGGDYEGFRGDPGHEFDVPITDSIEEILKHLKAKGLVELPRGGKRGRKKVKLV
ncbi:P-loop NTPase fold protein [Micrococcus sp. IITD107]|uniref:YobI family P-loop NTPase n=1 Tax=Micrococcus sp. IITD107 TaxID=3342790 RepID=UPI0035B7FF4E